MSHLADEIKKIIRFMGEVIGDGVFRKQYLENPMSVASEWGLSENPQITDKNGIFPRFLGDNDIVFAVKSKNNKKLESLIKERFPQLYSRDENQAAIAINDAVVANSSIVIGTNVVVALSTLKAVVGVSGINK